MESVENSCKALILLACLVFFALWKTCSNFKDKMWTTWAFFEQGDEILSLSRFFRFFVEFPLFHKCLWIVNILLINRQNCKFSLKWRHFCVAKLFFPQAENPSASRIFTAFRHIFEMRFQSCGKAVEIIHTFSTVYKLFTG